VIATARTPNDLDGLPVATRLQLDVTDQASVDAAISQAGQVDVLVANAGVAYTSSVEAMPVEDLERVFSLNVGGALRVTQALLPGMRKRQGGRIVLLSSLLGRIVVPMRVGYATSKWALEALGETLAIETAAYNIKVTLVEPGAVDTDGAKIAKSTITDDDPYTAAIESLKSLRSVPLPTDDVAKAIADTIEDPAPPLRVPIGESTRRIIAAHDNAPRHTAFNVTDLAAGSGTHDRTIASWVA
jgi:NAD(P)-dependent dehydrogenase (short-subunit alcohol dehydrogenase family)